ncbi:endogenous retrovirus group K member 18 Pol -like protein [Labeo rohita]|uniref:Endogenous retrovirus group K member 18 Pol-like protein n=1 Tax=Labeo rohita TaxID=84645 RepID=A0A498MB73_LABRO|nr:endogenous retrovirus group K member 18 Pol -like protein [Labeo rohita]
MLHSSGLRRSSKAYFTSDAAFFGTQTDKTSSVQAQKTSDNNLSAVGRSEKDQKADLLTANQKKEAVRVVADGSSSSAGIRSSEQKPSELPTAIQKSKPVTDADAALTSDTIDFECALSDLHMSRMDSSDLKKIQLIKVKSCIENHFPDFKGQHQQDAHEFLMACLSCLKKESNALKLSHPTYTCPVSSKEFKLKNERNCSRSWIPDCAIHDKYLRSLIDRKAPHKTPLNWTDEAEMHFAALKKAITTAPSLGLPSFEKEFHLHVRETEGVAMGVLLQQHGSTYRPVAYLSKKLDNVAAGMPACLRAVSAAAIVVQMAEKIVLSHPMIVYTSHQALTLEKEKQKNS